MEKLPVLMEKVSHFPNFYMFQALPDRLVNCGRVWVVFSLLQCHDRRFEIVSPRVSRSWYILIEKRLAAVNLSLCTDVQYPLDEGSEFAIVESGEFG